MAKAAVQRVLSAMPDSEGLNYVMQRRVTKQLPRSDQHFHLHAIETLRHFEAFKRHARGLEPGAARFYEFGAGWDLITPLIYHGLGVDDQTLVDIRPNLRFDELNHSLLQYERQRDALAGTASQPLRALDAAPITALSDLKERFGITYLAPRDARRTDLAGGSFDFASSTFTLEHIRAEDIAAILTETRRLLRPGALVSSAVDMQDHYSYFDPTISAYNFLKFSDRTWRVVNSPLHHQNRLRRCDYAAIHESAGFELLEQAFDPPSQSDLTTVRELSLAPRFRGGYGVEEIAIRAVRIVGRKPAEEA